MEKIIQELTKIYFTKNEASIYTNLLKNPGQTVYQLAKNLNMSRSSLYPVINKMYERGMVVLLNCASQIYYPEKPSILLQHLQNEYNNQITYLETELSAYEQNNHEEQFINIKNKDANLRKIIELISKAEKEVYINMDIKINFIDEALEELRKRGVKVYIFSFNRLDYQKENVIISSKNFPASDNPTRVMLVVDLKEVLIVSINKQDWFGTYTNNNLMVNIVSEHIHHDFYINSLEQKYGADILRRENVYLNSLFEKANHVTKTK